MAVARGVACRVGRAQVVGVGRRVMAERGRARDRSETWMPGIAGAHGPAGLPGWRGLGARAGGAPGGLGHWLPVAFGLGIVIYFTAEHEPLWWAALALTVVLSVATAMVR